MGELRELVTDDEDEIFDVCTDDGTIHRLDLIGRTVTTRRADGSTTEGGVVPRQARLVTVATCRVGHPMVVLIDRGVPGVSFTHRTTPPVVRIDRVSAPLDRRPQEER